MSQKINSVKFKRIIAFLLLISVLFSFGCTKGKGTAEEESKATDASVENDDKKENDNLTLFKKGETDYVIICNFSDTQGKEFANDVASLLNKTFKAGIPVKSHSSNYGHEIIIGETNREATLKVKSQINPSSDFALMAVDDDLVLYATDTKNYKHLYFYLRDVLLKDIKDKNLDFSAKTDNYISTLRPEDKTDGSQITFLEGGKSNFKIVYNIKDGNSLSQAAFLKDYLKEKLGISIPIVSDTSESKNEIILCGSNRDKEKSVSKRLDSKDDFAVCLVGDDIVMTGTDNEMQVLGMVYFAQICENQMSKEKIVLKEIDNYIYSEDSRGYEYDAAEYCKQYQKLYNTYSSYHEDKLYNKSWIPEKEKLDQKLVEALIERMGNSASVCIGCTTALYNGKVNKLDTKNYMSAAVLKNGEIFIPVMFAEKYFGEKLTADKDGYINLSAHCKSNGNYTLYHDVKTGVAIITPKGVKSFENETESDGNYTNRAYIDRMNDFFHPSLIHEPHNPTEQTRTVIEFVEYPKYVLDFKTNEYITTYSPSIEIVKENGKSVYYAVYELCLVKNFDELDVNTVVKKSLDGGKTWDTVVEKIPDLRWSSVFESKGTVYLLGSNLKTGDCEIVKLGENGEYKRSVICGAGKVGGGTAPGTVLHAYGRIYKAYHGSTISADEDLDLMNPDSWTVSNTTKAEGLAPKGAEGSMVLGKDGNIYQVMHTDHTQSAYVLNLSKDGKTYTPFSPSTNNEVDFPTCISKSSVIYDEISGKYISLSNICNTDNKRQRNVLALVYSEDLINWKIADYVLVERDMINPVYSTTAHAFQYADFKIDGDDLVMIIREASGYTNTYHDGNYTTFYRYENFRSSLDGDR